MKSIKYRYKIMFLFLILLTTVSGQEIIQSQIIQNSKLDGLNDSVRSVFEISDNDTIQIALYDSLGRTTKRSFENFGACSNSRWPGSSGTWYYSYNKKGLMSSAIHFYSYMDVIALEPGESNDHIDDYFYSYNKKGQLISEYKIGGDIKGDPGGTFTYQYNKAGKVISKKKYSNQMRGRGPIDSLEEEKKYIYNNKDQLIESREYNYQFYDKGSFSAIIYKYDNAGNLIESYNKSEKGNVWNKQITIYDSIQRKKSSTLYWGPGVVENNYNYTYGSSGFEVEHFTYSDKGGRITSKSITGYDTKQRVVRLVYFSSNLSIESDTKFIYEFDQYGNWIKCIGTRNGKEICINERRISYY